MSYCLDMFVSKLNKHVEYIVCIDLVFNTDNIYTDITILRLHNYAKYYDAKVKLLRSGASSITYYCLFIY